MASLVVLHVSFGRELLAAEVAGKRFFLRVDAHVDDQVGPLRERLLAPGERTSVGLGS
jgi:hypothetical protein